MIPYGRQSIDKSDIDEVVKVLTSDFLTQGPYVENFESSIKHYVGAKYAVATNSATSALHIACKALNVFQDDIVWTSTISFVASANAALYCGAKVDFIDIDPDTNNLSLKNLKDKLLAAKKINKLPKVLIVVHLSGLSCEMKEIFDLSKNYGFKIIEDASHAIGARYRGSLIGSCKYSDIVVFSFHPVKIITTGEGGMALTNNRNLFHTMQLLRSHGITRDPQKMIRSSDDPWYYEQIELGFNYRMTDIQAALGISQIKRITEFLSKRRSLVSRYNDCLDGYSLKLPNKDFYSDSAFHLYIVRLQPHKINLSHKEVIMELRKRGIGVNLHYIPIHTQPFYKKMGFIDNDFPEAMKYYAEAISLPLFPDLSEKDQDFIIDNLKEILLI